jgi:hypothetical protein
MIEQKNISNLEKVTKFDWKRLDLRNCGHKLPMESK